MTNELERFLDPAFAEGTDALVRGLEDCRAALEGAGFSGDPGSAAASVEALDRLFEGLVVWMERLPAAIPRLAPVLRDTVEGWIMVSGEAGVPDAERAAHVVGWLDRDPEGALRRIVRRFADAIDPDLREALVREARERGRSSDVMPRGRGLGAADWLGLEYVLRSESDSVDAWLAVADGADDHSVGRVVWECTALAESGRVQEALEAAVRARSLVEPSDAWSARVAVLEDDVLRLVGRDHEAFDAVFAAACAEPRIDTIARLRRLTRHPERSAAVGRAVARAEAGAGPIERCILLLATGDAAKLVQEIGRLSESDLQRLPPFVVREAVGRVEPISPLVAARLHLRIGMLDADEVSLGAQSRAMDAFDAARRCFERAGEPRRWRETLESLFERYDRNPMFGRVFRARFRPDGRPMQRPGAGPGAKRTPTGPPKPGPASTTGPVRPELPRSSPTIRPRGSAGTPAVFVRGGGGASRDAEAGGGPPRPPVPVSMPPSLSGIRNMPSIPAKLDKKPADTEKIDERAFDDRPASSVRRRAITRDEDGKPVVIRRRVRRDNDDSA